MRYLRMVQQREKEERRFQAKLAGFDVPDDEGRIPGLRQRQIAKMKARRGGH